MRLVIACACPAPGCDEDADVSRLAREITEWDSVTAAALAHGVLPHVYRSVRRLAATDISAAALHQLRSAFLKQAAWSFRLAAELRDVLTLLHCRGIIAVPFKGPALAHAVYGSVAARQAADLDLLVRPKDRDAVRRALLSRGYTRQVTPQFPHRWAEAALFYNTGYRRDDIMVEVHWALAEANYSVDIKTAPMWTRLEAVDLLGVRIHSLERHDLLIALCVHGARHGWTRLLWVQDIAEILRSSRSLEYDRLVQRARACGVERVVAIGLRLACDLLRATVPAHVGDTITADENVGSIVGALKASLCAGPQRSTDMLWLRLASRERLRDRLRQCQRLAEMPKREWGLVPEPFRWYLLLTIPFVPNERDWDFLPLPPFLRFAYFLIRPIRLALGWARRAFRV